MRKQTRGSRFRHLHRTDRDDIEILLKKGYAQADIARVIGVSRSTVSRELGKRERKNGRYEAELAEHKARVCRARSKYQGMRVEDLPLIRARIIWELKRYRSPDEIAGRINRGAGRSIVGKDAIYRWLYSAWGNQYARLLCTRRRRRRRQKRDGWRREMIPGRMPLAKRPKEGLHGEGDVFVSPSRAGTPASVAVVAERTSKYLWGTKLGNRRPQTMAQAMRRMTAAVRLDDLTLDNGVENKGHLTFGLPAYFCAPQSPWQKPLVEQTIGLIRRWFIPKGTDLRRISETELQSYVSIMNGKWRRSLGYASALEAARERGILKTKRPAEGQVSKVTRFHCKSCI